jgi:hypothetical protein
MLPRVTFRPGLRVGLAALAVAALIWTGCGLVPQTLPPRNDGFATGGGDDAGEDFVTKGGGVDASASASRDAGTPLMAPPSVDAGSDAAPAEGGAAGESGDGGAADGSPVLDAAVEGASEAGPDATEDAAPE